MAAPDIRIKVGGRFRGIHSEQMLFYDRVWARPGSARFGLLSDTGEQPYRYGDEVEIYKAGSLVWDGTIRRRPRKAFPARSEAYLSWSLQASEYSRVLEETRVYQAFTDMTAGAILQSLVDDLLPGWTLTKDTGPTWEGRLAFNGWTLKQILTFLARWATDEDYTFIWYYEPGKNVHWKEWTQLDAAAFDLTDAAKKYSRLDLDSNDAAFYNVAEYRGGRGLYTEKTVEQVAAEAETKFRMPAHTQAVNAIRVDGVEITQGAAGIARLGEDKTNPGTGSGQHEFGFHANTGLVERLANIGASWSDVDDITVAFDIEVVDEMVLIARNDASIARHGELWAPAPIVREGFGFFPSFARWAQADVDQHATATIEHARYDTNTAGLVPGAVQTINLTVHDVNQAVVLTRVAAQQQSRDLFLYSVEASGGNPALLMDELWTTAMGGGDPGTTMDEATQLRVPIAHQEDLHADVTVFTFDTYTA